MKTFAKATGLACLFFVILAVIVPFLFNQMGFFGVILIPVVFGLFTFLVARAFDIDLFNK